MMGRYTIVVVVVVVEEYKVVEGPEKTNAKEKRDLNESVSIDQFY